MRTLVVVAVAALTAILSTIALETMNLSWTQRPTVRTGAVGALSAVVAMSVSRNLRKKD